jgi:hypothetical protein
VERFGAAAVPRRTVIFTCAAQAISCFVPGSPGRWTRARTSWPGLNVTGREITSHSRSASSVSVSREAIADLERIREGAHRW